MAKKKKSWMEEYANKAVTPSQLYFNERPMATSGSLALDRGLGMGAVPYGAIIRFYGREQTCKSTLCQRMAADVLSQNMPVLWVDAEMSFIPAIAELNGIDPNNPLMRVVRPKTSDGFMMSFEDVITMVDDLLEDEQMSKNGCLIVIDSTSALLTNKEIEGDVEDAQIAQGARVSAKWLPKLAPKLTEKNATLVLISQVRDNFNAMSFGPKERAAGGRAIRHHAMIDIYLSPEAGITATGIDGRYIKFQIKKNKFYHSGVEGRLPYVYDHGVDNALEILEIGLSDDVKIFTKSGAFIKYNGQTIGQGMVAARDWLENNPEIMKQLMQKIKFGEVDNVGDASAGDSTGSIDVDAEAPSSGS